MARAASRTGPSSIHCVVNSIEGGLVRGWAVDREAPQRPARFFIIVDGQQVAEAQCTLGLPGGMAPPGGPEVVGYEITLPLALLDGQTHRMEFRDAWRRPVVMQVGDRAAESCDFAHRWRPKIQSFVDGLRGGAFEGWVLQSEHGSERLVGNCLLKIVCNELPVGFARANRYRADVAKSLAADAYCGFQFVPPAWARKSTPQDFHFYALPVGQELQNSPVLTSLVTDENEALVLELSETIDRLHVELTPGAPAHEGLAAQARVQPGHLRPMVSRLCPRPASSRARHPRPRPGAAAGQRGLPRVQASAGGAGAGDQLRARPDSRVLGAAAG